MSKELQEEVLDSVSVSKSVSIHDRSVIEDFRDHLRSRAKKKNLGRDTDMSEINGVIKSLNNEVREIYATTKVQE